MQFPQAPAVCLVYLSIPGLGRIWTVDSQSKFALVEMCSTSSLFTEDTPMKNSLILALAIGLAVGSASAQQNRAESPAAKEEGFEQLFDGKSFEGWEGNLEHFRIEDRAIVAGSLKQPIANNEFLCTKRRFSDFELRLEVRLLGEGKNAGVQFRSERIPDHHEMIGYQCDAGVAWDRPVWGGLYDESRRREMLAEGPAEAVKSWLKEDDWNELKIIARGRRIRLYLNGHQTVDYREADAEIPTSGLIGLQIHSGPPAEAWYRNIRIRDLTAKTKE